jgi:hypothetical protein
MATLRDLEATLINKDVTMLPEMYHDDINVQMLVHEFALFKDPVKSIQDAVNILQQMHPVSL